MFLAPNITTSMKEEGGMLYDALVFFIVAIIAGLFGFLGIAAAAAGIARSYSLFFACSSSSA
jgi:uncharacterized membrane protein YtjA (UPF0391 family)